MGRNLQPAEGTVTWKCDQLGEKTTYVGQLPAALSTEIINLWRDGLLRLSLDGSSLRLGDPMSSAS